MNGIVIILISIVFLILAYILYGGFLVKKFDINNKCITPAHAKKDGVDFVPAKMPVLLGHHFASIAGAAPIIGPVTAAVFGWVPVLLWLLIGGVFFGAMHDFASLVISIKNDGRSIGETIKKHVGKKGGILFLIFTWATLVLIISAFTIIVAKTFNTVPEAASSSVFFILLAVVFGFIINKTKTPLWLASIVGFIMLFVLIYTGNVYPIHLSMNTWVFILLAYVFVASVTPVWILLQPRDYLNSFLLYLLLGGGFLGVLFFNPEIQAPAVTTFKAENLGYLFPMLFVTVACGAISGFHSLVASGTTSKQISCENDAKPVAYGGMLIETFLGIIALIAAVMMPVQEYGAMLAQKGPVGVFSVSLAQVMNKIPLVDVDEKILIAFVSLIVSAFALTTLDTATRLGRFIFQEFSEVVSPTNIILKNKYTGTIITVIAGGALAYSGQWKNIWPIFGSANQLLAALALLSAALWFLKKYSQKPLFILLPMVFMFFVTIIALASLIHANFIKANYPLMTISIALLLLSIFLAKESFVILFKHNE